MRNGLTLRFWVTSTSVIFLGAYFVLMYHLLAGDSLASTGLFAFSGMIFGLPIFFLMPREARIRSSRFMNGTATSTERAWSRRWTQIGVFLAFSASLLMQAYDYKPSGWTAAFAGGICIGAAFAQLVFSIKNTDVIKETSINVVRPKD